MDKEEKQGEREKESKASIQNTAGNEFHYLFSCLPLFFLKWKTEEKFRWKWVRILLRTHVKIDLFFESEASFFIVKGTGWRIILTLRH